MTGSGFRRVTEQEIYQGYAVRLVNATIAAPDDQRFTRDIVYSPGAVAIVPVRLVDGTPEVTLVRQYRAPLDDTLLEIPAGLRDKPGENVAEVAARELQEEVGLRADTLLELTSFFNAAGMTDQRTWVFLATDLHEVPAEADGAEEQFMAVEQLPLATAVAMATDGRIADAKTVIGLLLAHTHFASVDPA